MSGIFQTTPSGVCCSVAKSCLTLFDPMDCGKPEFHVLRYLLEHAQTHVHWVSDAIQPSHLLSAPSPLAFCLSQCRVFSNELALHIRWPKYWSFSINSSNEYSGLISFKIDWFNLLVFLGNPQSSPAPQFKSINSLVFSLFYGPILTCVPDYWKNHSVDYTNLCCKVMSLLFNTLPRLVIAFLPRSRPSTVILEPKKIKSITVLTSPIYLSRSDGTRCHDLCFLNVEF